MAAPAAADREFDKGAFPHDITWINPYFDGPEAEIVTGEWVGIWTAWGPDISEQLEDFLTVATVEIFFDEAARDVGQSYFAPTVAFFEALVEPIPTGRTTKYATVITSTDEIGDSHST